MQVGHLSVQVGHLSVQVFPAAMVKPQPIGRAENTADIINIWANNKKGNESILTAPTA